MGPLHNRTGHSTTGRATPQPGVILDASKSDGKQLSEKGPLPKRMPKAPDTPDHIYQTKLDFRITWLWNGPSFRELTDPSGCGVARLVGQ